MGVKEFKERMNAIAVTHGDDEEVAHIQMDELMCEVLISLGYTDGVEVFNEQHKYYA